ncbi:glycoside hydrolase family 9 protein [Mucilaginibacter sp. ZT4R22]|uniref:Glycoside hydrolase family 9 protein n=1 Tax=Mucilaginibacter pankratovii TaxID=2772110 RepID=A0ABR7WZQ0_9SPHI|nr:glycoside hydrolase family 9 protein [Mucilaginibacter pankratovii]MBD1366934.1 glycoside hydrolase family 9 protein [Mucilaginibacter pankratovii]
MKKFYLSLLSLFISCCAFAAPVIYLNQVAFDSNSPKVGVLQFDNKLTRPFSFNLVNVATGRVAYTGMLTHPETITDWLPGKLFFQANFSAFKTAGKYRLRIKYEGLVYTSYPFEIGESMVAKRTLSAIIHYYNKQRANTPGELAADAKMQLFGSNQRVDLRGGWCDASGDVSKYFSHLAYANYFSPQQTPLVTWSMVSASEAIPGLLNKWKLKDSLDSEALYGADYMMRALSKDDYFYMIVFSYFNKDPNARRVVGLLANSITTNQYQCAFREGGGMAIAALARISQWKKNGEFTSAQYLDGAKRAFAHLLINNTKYDDDGKENIIDDYCALMAATELWIATGEDQYRDEARKRAKNLNGRMTDAGYFISNDTNRPYFHASDAGLPVVALSRYLDKEKEDVYRAAALKTIRQSLDYQLAVTNKISNPFGYARQSFLFKGKVKDGFFIPHENETGWWWQGENARLGSLATAAVVGGRLAYPAEGNWGIKSTLADYAERQLSWIMGCNPYSISFIYGFGKNNMPYMASNYGHGSERGGISNGVTGKDGCPDGSGIDFKKEAKGDEWRWTEQWIPHAAWFLQAVAVMAQPADISK